MKLECPQCSHQIEFDLEIKVKSRGCRFCHLGQLQQDFIQNFLLAEGNIAKVQRECGSSRELVMKVLADIVRALMPDGIPTNISYQEFILNSEMIYKLMETLGKQYFTTDPDFISVLQQTHPEVIGRFIGESPRNWKARIGRRLSRFSAETGAIRKAGRLCNSQIWEIVQFEKYQQQTKEDL